MKRSNREDVHIVDWKITTKCQCECEFCYASCKVDEMKKDKYIQVVDCIKRLNCERVCITGGEPMLSENFSDILKLLYENGIKITLSTNGLKYSFYKDDIEKYVNRISLPLDGYDSFSNSCNGRPIENFDSILDILESTKKFEKKIDIKIATVLTRKNAKLEHFKKMYEKLCQYDITQWKIYELIKEGRGFDNKDELSIGLGNIKDLIEFFNEINGEKFKVNFVQKNARNRAYFMVQPNADVIVPVEDKNGMFKDEKIGNLLKESIDYIYNAWKSLIDFEVYKKNCSRRIL